LKEFKSRLEALMPAEELTFPPTPGFKPFHKLFHPDSIAHPAKANVLLLYYLIKKYTREGNWVVVTEGLLKQLDRVVEWCECQHGER
jgi:hypothetical protein